MIDPLTASETARLRDLRILGLERRPRVFLKMCMLFIEERNESGSAKVPPANYVGASQPSTEALPVFWDLPDQDLEVAADEGKDGYSELV
jgi:hypothetical protein